MGKYKRNSNSNMVKKQQAKDTQQLKDVSPDDIILIGVSGEAYLPGIKALASTSGIMSRDMFDEPDTEPQPFKHKNKEYKGVVHWGEDNDLPNQILEKIEKCEVLSAGLYFNSFTAYGEGLLPCYYGFDARGKQFVKHYSFKGIELKKQIRELQLQEIDLGDSESQTDKKKLEYVKSDLKELEDKFKIWEKTQKEIKEFFSFNDVNYLIYEQLIDINFFFMAVPLLILNKDNKIVRIKHREAIFSRWEVKNEKGKIEHMFYSHKWADGEPEEEELIVYDVLDADSPLYNLKQNLGLVLNDEDKKEKKKIFEYIVPMPMPSPGRFYYPNSPYYAIFLSGWYDLWTKVPEGKNSIFDNITNLSYHIELSDDYFPDIFKEEGITEREAKKVRIKTEYTKLNDYLAGKGNMGKSVVSFITYGHDKTEKRKMKITPIDSPFKGGEYIEDSEEASNMIDQAIWVHPSIIGASPGKNKNINGTEARELFIIKNSIQKPVRDRIVKPYYITKNINGWDEELEWLIPNMELTTLDKNSGSEKKVS